MAVTAFQTIGLVSVEVRHRADLQPTFLCFGIYFEVVANGRSKAHVASAKPKDTIRKFQFLEQAFYVCQHFLVGLFRMFRFVNAYQFHFRKFLQTVQATHILTVGTGFTTETLRIGTILDGQILFV